MFASGKGRDGVMPTSLQGIKLSNLEKGWKAAFPSPISEFTFPMEKGSVSGALAPQVLICRLPEHLIQPIVSNLLMPVPIPRAASVGRHDELGHAETIICMDIRLGCVVVW
jgi:hypothetical protein